MVGDLNRWVGIGRLTKDPELKYTPNGTAVCTFSIASNAVYYQNSEKKEKVNYFNLIAWGKTGESVVEFCRKGMRLGIEGRASYKSWTDSRGSKYSSIEFIVDSYQFLDPKKDGKQEQRDPDDPGDLSVPAGELYTEE